MRSMLVGCTSNNGQRRRVIPTPSKDIGTTEGRTRIYNDGAKARVVLVSGTAYIEGNAKGVADYFELPNLDPQTLAGKWFSVAPANSNYSTYVAGVTLKSDFSEIQFPGPYKVGPQTVIDHRKVIPVHGSISASSKGAKLGVTLYITATGRILPVEITTSNNTEQATEIWSNWGRPADLVAPVTSQPIPEPLTETADRNRGVGDNTVRLNKWMTVAKGYSMMKESCHGTI